MMRVPGRWTMRLAIFLLVSTMSLVSCDSEKTPSENIKLRIQALEERTVPPGSVITSKSGPVKDNWSVKASWEIESDNRRDEYSKWVMSRLCPEFRVVKHDDARLVLSKYSGGDTETVELEFRQAREALRVRIAFSAYPD